MLVLTRKVGEEIVIGDTIRVTLVEVGPGRVKIGISAPREMSVDRAEVRAKKDVEPTAIVSAAPHNRVAEHIAPAVDNTPAPLSMGGRLKNIRRPIPRKG
jgi:carbon storage regulator